MLLAAQRSPGGTKHKNNWLIDAGTLQSKIWLDGWIGGTGWGWGGKATPTHERQPGVQHSELRAHETSDEVNFKHSCTWRLRGAFCHTQ